MAQKVAAAEGKTTVATTRPAARKARGMMVPEMAKPPIAEKKMTTAIVLEPYVLYVLQRTANVRKAEGTRTTTVEGVKRGYSVSALILEDLKSKLPEHVEELRKHDIDVEADYRRVQASSERERRESEIKRMKDKLAEYEREQAEIAAAEAARAAQGAPAAGVSRRKVGVTA